MAKYSDYGSTVKDNLEEAFRGIEQFAVNTADTEDLVAQLVVRMGCWFEDPEPQFDDYFSQCSQKQLEVSYRYLRELDRKFRVLKDE